VLKKIRRLHAPGGGSHSPNLFDFQEGGLATIVVPPKEKANTEADRIQRQRQKRKPEVKKKETPLAVITNPLPLLGEDHSLNERGKGGNGIRHLIRNKEEHERGTNALHEPGKKRFGGKKKRQTEPRKGKNKANSSERWVKGHVFFASVNVYWERKEGRKGANLEKRIRIKRLERGKTLTSKNEKGPSPTFKREASSKQEGKREQARARLSRSWGRSSSSCPKGEKHSNLKVR